MAFDIMSLFGPSAVNRMLQPAQNANGVQNFLANPQAAQTQQSQADPWAGMRQAQVDQMPVASTQPFAQQTRQTGGFGGIDKAMLNDIFLGWAMGQTPMQSLSLGAAQASKGKSSRAAQNDTVKWLTGRGLDADTARMVASDPQTLQKYLTDIVSPEKKKPLEINGKLVDPTTYQVLADFSAPKDGTDGRTALMKELEAAGLKPGTPEYQEAILSNNKPKGMMIESDGQGGFRMVQGTDVSGGANLNVEQGKNTGFLIRAQDADKVINSLESEGTSGWNKLAGSIPGVGNYMVGPDAQRFSQAKRDFINAVLRQESGAVISPEEFANAEQQYFPQPGDSADVIAQKRQNRNNAILGFKVRSGPGAQSVDKMQAQKPLSEMTDQELEAIVNGGR